MNVNEAAALLGLNREKVESLISDGLALAISKKQVLLTATLRGSTFEISDDDLDVFIAQFVKEDPRGIRPWLSANATGRSKTSLRDLWTKCTARLSSHD